MTYDLAKLRKLITQYFNEDDLKTFCFDLELDYDDLGAIGKSGKVRELVALMKRTERLEQLLVWCAKERPHVTWSQALMQPPPSSPISTFHRRNSQSVRIFIAKLPTTGRELFGREDEMSILDKAWANPHTHILSWSPGGALANRHWSMSGCTG